MDFRGFVGVHLEGNTEERCDWWVLGETRILAIAAQRMCLFAGEGRGGEVGRLRPWNILVIFCCFILLVHKKLKHFLIRVSDFRYFWAR